MSYIKEKPFQEAISIIIRVATPHYAKPLTRRAPLIIAVGLYSLNSRSNTLGSVTERLAREEYSRLENFGQRQREAAVGIYSKFRDPTLPDSRNQKPPQRQNKSIAENTIGCQFCRVTC